MIKCRKCGGKVAIIKSFDIETICIKSHLFCEECEARTKNIYTRAEKPEDSKFIDLLSTADVIKEGKRTKFIST